VFQFESSAQRTFLPYFRPETQAHLEMATAAIRPGPIQAGTVQPLARRRRGEEPVTYPHYLLEAALEETYGVLLFQEQVLKTVRDLAGFTAGEGEQFRRALGSKRPQQEIERLREQFIAGAKANDVLEEIAEQVFENLKAFGGYAFPKSHVIPFAQLAIEMAALKYHWPAHLTAALLSSQPIGLLDTCRPGQRCAAARHYDPGCRHQL
jgi:error-prone DNA polymerase